MAKNRYINTHFWSDNYVSELDPIEKLLFIYFLTNPFTNIAGIYEITLRQIALDTGIDKDMILRLLERFAEDKKIFYIEGWIFIVNFTKHQDQGSKKVKAGIISIFNAVPIKIKNRIFEAVKGIDSLSDLIKIIIKSNLIKTETKTKSDKPDFVDNIISVFKSEFEKIKKIDYEISNQEQERSAAGKILNSYKKKNPDSTSEKCLDDLRKIFCEIINISENAASEYLRAITLVKLNSKKTEYLQLKNKSNESTNNKLKGVVFNEDGIKKHKESSARIDKSIAEIFNPSGMPGDQTGS